MTSQMAASTRVARRLEDLLAALRTVALRTVALRTVALRTAALRTAALRTAAWRAAALRTAALRTAALRTAALRTARHTRVARRLEEPLAALRRRPHGTVRLEPPSATTSNAGQLSGVRFKGLG